MNMCVCLAEVSIGYCSSLVIQLLRWFLTVLNLTSWLASENYGSLCLSLPSTAVTGEHQCIQLYLSSIFTWTQGLQSHCYLSQLPSHSWAFEVLLIHEEKDTEMNICDGQNLKMPVRFHEWGRWTSCVLRVIKRSMKLPDSTACPPERGTQGRISDRRFWGQGDMRHCGHSDFL